MLASSEATYQIISGGNRLPIIWNPICLYIFIIRARKNIHSLQRR